MRSLLFVAFLMAHTMIPAQKVITVEGSYIYKVPETVTVEQAKRIALERAQIEILAKTFGTKISQQNSTRISNDSRNSSVDFLSISSSDVQGEWVETIGKPDYTISYASDMLIVNCKVKGIVRAVTTVAIDLIAKIFNNSSSHTRETTEFKQGDQLFLQFQSPVNGYLAVYLIDNSNQAFCLLPYKGQGNGIYKVNGNRNYTFFSIKDANKEERLITDEYVMTCESSFESNQIYILFSPNQFTKAADFSSDQCMPRTLNGDDFLRWLGKCKRRDSQFTVISKLISVTK